MRILGFLFSEIFAGIKNFILYCKNKIISIYSTRKDTFSAVFAVLLVLIGSFCLWYFVNSSFWGFIFLLIVSFLVFTISLSFLGILNSILKKMCKDYVFIDGCVIPTLSGIMALVVFCSGFDIFVSDKNEKRNNYYSLSTVYVTPYGECYHEDESCITIEGHEIEEVSKEEAIDMGRRPCEICCGANN